MADLLAQPSDLRTFLGASEAELPTDTATLALTMASALVQAATRQRLVAVDNDQVELTGVRGRLLPLPERPVTGVSLVQLMDYGATQWFTETATSYQVVGGAVWRQIPWFAHRFRVTYSHGFAVIPEDLRWVVLTVAARHITNQQGVRTETIGSYSYTLASDQAGASLNSYEQQVCNRYRQRTYAMRR